MTHRPLDDELDALLADPAGDAVLGSFVEDLRFLASGPPPAPSPALLELLDGGRSADKGDLPVTAVSNAHGPARQVAGLPEKRKKRMPIPQFIAGLSLAGKLALGAGVAAAATTTGAAAGVLPEPVQQAVEQTFDAVTPFGSTDEADAVDTPDDEADAVDTPDDVDGADGTDGPADRAAFGQAVRADATDDTPGVDGAAVSAAAREKSGRPEDAGSAAPDGAGNGKPATAGSAATDGSGAGAGAAGDRPTPQVSVPGSPPVSTPPVSTPRAAVPKESSPPVSTPRGATLR